MNPKRLKVGDSDNSDDINKTFETIEYYSLANNGQTWYFAIADGEVYYCRRIDPKIDLKDVLKSFNFSNLTPDNFKTFFQFKFNGYRLVEYGLGNLETAEGRALPDARNYNQFKYFDFKYGSKSYSLDIFPDGELEWFETVFIPQKILTNIFEESLRLGNGEVSEILDQASTWKIIAIFAFFSSLLLIIMAFGFSVYKQEIKNDSREFLANKSQEIVYSNFEINNPNQLYTFETKVDLVDGKGVNLDISFLNKEGKPVSTTNQELYRYVTTDSEDDDVNKENLSFFTEFFPKQKDTFTPIIKINDYGNVGQSLSSQSQASCYTLEKTNCVETADKIKMKMILYKGGVIWTQWIGASVLVALVGVLAVLKNKSLRSKAWK